MSEGKRPNQPQRYCTNCGAEIRSETSFCVSCGVALSPTDTSEITDDVPNFERAPQEEQANEAEEPRPVGLSTSTGSGTSATVPPGSIVNRRAWYLVAVLVIFTAGGILYGTGFSETASETNRSNAESRAVSAPGLPVTTSASPSSSSASPSAPSVAPDSLSDITPSSGIPYYEVIIARDTAGLSVVQCTLRVEVQTEFERYEEDTELVFNDVGGQTANLCDFVDLTVYNYNDIEIPRLSSGGYVDYDGGEAYLAQGFIAHTSVGETVTSVPQGSYSIDYYY